MKGEWKEVRLGDYIANIATGPFGSNLKVDDFISCGIPVLEGSNLKGIKVSDSISKFVSEEKAESLHRSIANRGDVVVTIRGTIGQIAYVPLDSRFEGYVCCQSQFRVTFDERIDVPFIVYFFHSPQGQKRLLSFANQVGVPALAQPLKNFPALRLPLPPLPTQRRIAAVLGALDDKIELNRKMNENLEAQAQALFKSWFVDFAPWGGKMPLGWKKGTLGEIAEYSSGRLSVDNVKCEYYSTDGMMADRQGATASALPATGNVVDVDVGDTLVSNIRPYFKKIFHATAKCTCSTDVLCFKPISPCWEYFLYRALWSDDFFAHAVAGAKGTKMPRGDKSQMMCFEIVKPNEDTLVDFNRLISPMCQQIASNVTQCAKLAELRDALLPKLMSGELSVSAAEPLRRDKEVA